MLARARPDDRPNVALDVTSVWGRGLCLRGCRVGGGWGCVCVGLVGGGFAGVPPAYAPRVSSTNARDDAAQCVAYHYS